MDQEVLGFLWLQLGLCLLEDLALLLYQVFPEIHEVQLVRLVQDDQYPPGALVVPKQSMYSFVRIVFNNIAAHTDLVTNWSC